MSEEERQAIIHLLDKQARYEYAKNSDISFSDEDYEAYIIRQSMIRKDKEIKRLTQALLDIKEYIEKSYKEDYGNNENYIPIEHLNLKNCSYERSLVVLDIVNKALGSDKE